MTPFGPSASTLRGGSNIYFSIYSFSAVKINSVTLTPAVSAARRIFAPVSLSGLIVMLSLFRLNFTLAFVCASLPIGVPPLWEVYHKEVYKSTYI
nr:MAG TPA: hypothetical protein [Caudoviricetes sp.]